MTDESTNKSKKFWPRNLVNKWLNIKSKDHAVKEDGSYRRASDRIRPGKIDLEAFEVTDVSNYRVFVGTWNVAGKSPPNHLNLEDWLHTSPPADIYVLGFQEIVPLNAGNVLGTQDNVPPKKWLALITKTLNTPSPILNPILEHDANFEESLSRHKASSYCHRRSLQILSRSMRVDQDVIMPYSRLDRRFSLCEYRCDSSDDESDNTGSPMSMNSSTMRYNESLPCEENLTNTFCLVASKQMVGIFLTLWVKRDLRDHVRNLKVSCVGRGLMGYLGNKGSISISMALHKTSFCFVCSHLTSGQKDGDEIRRNLDVMEILRKTRFPRINDIDDESSPQTILEHDRVIWLGDLNYRIALSYRAAKALVEMRNWRTLLENDQLRREQKQGRVFSGWNEGKIHFPPTYKYLSNSDRYTGDSRHPKKKRRTPAWCDRILWYGKGVCQLSYVRGESRFSDHRPVYSVFLAEVEGANRRRLKKSMSCSSARVEVEELLPYLQG